MSIRLGMDEEEVLLELQRVWRLRSRSAVIHRLIMQKKVYLRDLDDPMVGDRAAQLRPAV